MNCTIKETRTRKPIPADVKKGFGNIFTDHMLLMDYTADAGWHDPRILPFGELPFTPATMCFHYGQEIFEGMRAFRTADGHALMFRPMDHLRRLNRSCERMCIPQINPEEVLEYLVEFLRLDRRWLQEWNVDSIYLRPMIIASEPVFGARPSRQYTFMTTLTPGRAYVKEGPAAKRIYVEKDQARTVKGGTGTAKCAGNYAATFAAQAKASALGFDQVLWLDGVERRYCEEMGQMNIFFQIDGKLITPSLETGTILDGITRRSILTLAKELAIPAEERRIAIQEVVEAHQAERLDEVFGCGTGASVAPVCELSYDGLAMKVGNGKIGPNTLRIFRRLTDYQRGCCEDTYHWTRQLW